MSELLELVREDLRDFAGYSSARRAGVSGRVWLNANENPWLSPADDGIGLNRYPDPQPMRLRAALASLYGARPEQLLIGRGSDEAIDLLVRVLCRPGRDAVVIAPPVFGMYAVCARLQGAPLVEVPLVDGEDGFYCDLQQLGDRALEHGARLVFLCSPANPTGQAIALDDIASLARRLRGQALVVVDEAYGEYSSQPSAVTLLAENSNIAVLRTMSKAHALAAVRIGVLVADAALIALLRNCQAPYPLPAPCVELALAALSASSLQLCCQRVALLVSERQKLLPALVRLAGVRRAYPSSGNYFLVRFFDAERAFRQLLAAGVVVRDMRASPQLSDALRISIGTPEENAAVLSALATMGAAQ